MTDKFAWLSPLILCPIMLRDNYTDREHVDTKHFANSQATILTLRRFGILPFDKRPLNWVKARALGNNRSLFMLQSAFFILQVARTKKMFHPTYH